jgi:dihydroxyacetone kinase DhaKLM complex PTS-EIIA-like component DhaM
MAALAVEVMPRLKLTITHEYDAEPSSYGTSDPVVMAAIDQRQMEDDYLIALDAIGNAQGDVVIKVEPAE